MMLVGRPLGFGRTSDFTGGVRGATVTIGQEWWALPLVGDLSPLITIVPSRIEGGT
jgi:hypothetical protein